MAANPFFTGARLDRADSIRSDPSEIAALAASPLARELVWAEDFPALGPDGKLVWSEVVRDPALFLGVDDGAPRFSPARTLGGDEPNGFSLAGSLCGTDAPLFACALSLARWHGRNGHCPSCGGKTIPVRGGWSRSCLGCSAEHHPRVDPVVIMLVEHGDSLLLGRQYRYPQRRFSALAGFLEVGESIEDAVVREVKEEAGVDVEAVRYVASQPWPFPSSLMIGCQALASGRELKVDYSELEDARWFCRAEIERALAKAPDAPFEPPPPHAIARTLIERWLAA